MFNDNGFTVAGDKNESIVDGNAGSTVDRGRGAAGRTSSAGGCAASRGLPVVARIVTTRRAWWTPVSTTMTVSTNPDRAGRSNDVNGDIVNDRNDGSTLIPLGHSILVGHRVV